MPRRRGGRRPNKDKTNSAPGAEGASKDKPEGASSANGGKDSPNARNNKPKPKTKPKPEANKESNTGEGASSSQSSRSRRSRSWNRKPKGDQKPEVRRESQEHPLPDYVEYVTGDLFENINHAKAIAFGCHPEGEFNTELTLKFRQKHPELYAEYVNACRAGAFLPGEVLMWQTREGVMVYMLATQKDKYMQLASAQEIEAAFLKVRQHADEHQIDSIAMPQIGSGLGALNWPRSRRSLERVFKGWQGKMFIYTKLDKVERERL